MPLPDLTPAGLQAVLERQKWVFAKTAAKRNPHWYTLRKTWENDALFVAAVACIRKYGRPVPFPMPRNKYTRDYLQLDLGEWYYWEMGDPDPQKNTILINRKRLDGTVPDNP